MELQHRFTVPASVDTTWELFNDLEQVAPCFPGASLTSTDGDDFAGTVKVKLGPISLQYNGTGSFVERDAVNHVARFEARGKDKRGNGTAKAAVRTVLKAEGEQTTVEVTTDLAITGKPAQFGRGLMQDVSDKLLATFVGCLSDKLSDNGQPAASESVAKQPPAEPAAEPTPSWQPASERPAEKLDALDLGMTVLPVLARRFGPAALGVTALVAVVWWLLRRR
jgi:uncharacterized protein